MKQKHTDYAPEFKAQLGAAMAASRADDHEAVLEICKGLAESGPCCKPVQILIGAALWKTGRKDEARLILGRATRIYPSSELLSLLYFQILMELDKVDKAKSEASRFLSIRSSTDYAGIIEDYGWAP